MNQIKITIDDLKEAEIISQEFKKQYPHLIYEKVKIEDQEYFRTKPYDPMLLIAFAIEYERTKKTNSN